MSFKKTLNKITYFQLLISLGCSTIVSIFFLTIYESLKYIEANSQRSECYNSSQVKLNSKNTSVINGQIQPEIVNCFYLYASSKQQLNINSNIKIRIITPTGKFFLSQGQFQEDLKENGEYLIRIDPDHSPKSYSLNFYLKDTAKEGIKKTIPSQDKLLLLSYNSKQDPKIFRASSIQEIVNSAVNLASSQGLPTDKLSISLINLNNSSHGEYQEQVPRFPASLSKLFWLIVLFGHYDANREVRGAILEEDLQKMMQDSDNNIASQVLDQITNTNSGPMLPNDEFERWAYQRKSVNYYFESAGYKNINLTQKNFPIPDLNFSEPSGRDKQLRGDTSKPIRNFITSYSVARLLIDIDQGKAVSPNYSQYAKSLMKRDFLKEKSKHYDSIKGFLGEGLNPDDITQFSKPGWTADSRQDATIIYSRDGKTRYILVVIGDSKEFAQDWYIFPKISKLVYDLIR